MRKTLVALTSLLLCWTGLQVAPTASALDSPGGRHPSEVAASGTPHVLDGRVYAVTRVGNTIVLGGTFTLARNDNSQTQLSRQRLLAFDAQTGQISTTFVPQPNGTVHTVIPADDGVSVYVGGAFTSIGGVARQRIARVRVSDGAVLTGFNAGSVSGQVRDLKLADGRLWAAGAFTHVANGAQKALAALNPATGARLPFMTLLVDGFHNDGNTQVLKIDVSPDGSRLVAVGNFSSLQGVPARQLLMLDLTGPTAQPSTFRTDFYSPPCLARAFDSYMRDVDFSPDGSFFVVSTTGAYGGSSGPCDTTARFETAASGDNVPPSWLDYTGGDTSYGVEITDSAVYVGGHFRWQNNPFAGDRPGQGAVPRAGIAALDPTNGLPYSWNPGRTLGVGLFDFLPTEQGLWVASDTDRIGNFQYKGRIARMPFTGTVFPRVTTPGLPNDLYIAGSNGVGTAPPGGIGRRAATPTSFGALQQVPNGSIDWANVRGGFMLNGQLYLAHSNGDFTRRSFDGTTYGAAQPVNTQDQLVVLQNWRNDIASMTGMFYDSGRIYFTRSGSNQLTYRYFTPESDVVGAHRYVASNNVTGINFSAVRGMFTDGGSLYWAATDGALRRMEWVHSGPSGAPTPGTATVVSAPGAGGVTWGARAFFLYQDAEGNGVGLPPTAAFTSSCQSLGCSFDASGSAAPGGSISSYAWDFGDGGQGTGQQPDHTYAAAGDYQVELTITTATGQSSSTTRTITVQRVNLPPTAAFSVSCAGLTCVFNGSGSSDPDGQIAAWAWSFPGGVAAFGQSTTHTFPTEGQKSVTLTVTDDEGASDSTTQQIEVAATGIESVGAASGNANTTAHRVAVPATVQAGDLLVLTMAVNSSGHAVTGPSGWTPLASADGNNVLARSWTRRATAADAGVAVQVTTGGTVKADLSVAAYRGTGGATASVLDHQVAFDQALGTDHAAPSATVPAGGGWVVRHWAAKASTAVSWTTPAGQQVRTESAGAGGGAMTGVLTDTGGSVGAGPTGGSVAVTDPAVSRVVMFTTVVGAG